MTNNEMINKVIELEEEILQCKGSTREAQRIVENACDHAVNARFALDEAENEKRMVIQHGLPF